MIFLNLNNLTIIFLHIYFFLEQNTIKKLTSTWDSVLRRSKKNFRKLTMDDSSRFHIFIQNGVWKKVQKETVVENYYNFREFYVVSYFSFSLFFSAYTCECPDSDKNLWWPGESNENMFTGGVATPGIDFIRRVTLPRIAHVFFFNSSSVIHSHCFRDVATRFPSTFFLILVSMIHRSIWQESRDTKSIR